MIQHIKVFICFLIMLIAKSVFADDFTDIIHSIGVYSACLGQYSATQFGGTSEDDPEDFYTPQVIASYLAEQSGERTKTDTFYGICFDYANCAYGFLKENASEEDYAPGGLRKNQFFIAVSADDPNIIELSSPVSAKEGIKKWNGVHVKTYGNDSYKEVRTHYDCTCHAWLWIQRYDGVWFWVDPTWTDNLGYVVYGYVGNGKEIQCRPDKDWCVKYPSELDLLPEPPKCGEKSSTYKDPVLEQQEVYIKDNELYYWEFTVPKAANTIGIHCVSDALFYNIMSFAVVSTENDIEKFHRQCLGYSDTVRYIPGSYKPKTQIYKVNFDNLKPGKTYYFCAFKGSAFFASSQYVLQMLITW